MTSPVRTLVAIDDGVSRGIVEAALPYDATFQIVALVEGLQESLTTIEEVDADAIVIACGAHSERALLLAETSMKQQPDRPVIVLVDGSPNGLVRRAFEVGVDDLVSLPAKSDDLRFALQKALARRSGTASSSATGLGPLVVVLGPKGGTGKTLTCANLGVALAMEGKRVALLDLDLQFGDLGLALGLRPDRTIFDLARAGGSLDRVKLDSYLGTHESGVRVLMAPTRPDQAAAVTVELLQEVYAVLRSAFDFVLVDTPPGFTPEVIGAIDRSSEVCVVAALDALSLKNTKLGLETLGLMGYDESRISLVLNRADTKVGIDPEDVVAIVGRNPDVLVPSDRDVPRAVNDGTPIVSSKPSSRVSAAFRGLAQTYIERATAAPAATAPTQRRFALRRR